MGYVICGVVCFIIFTIILLFVRGYFDIPSILCSIIILIIMLSLIVLFDYKSQTDDYEIWSGKIVSVKHIEEWTEHIPARTETYTTKDSKGNVVTKTRYIPEKWIHHDAENYITTSDRGTISVYQIPSGKKLTDDFVNSTSELEQYYPIGSPTASVHTYENKLRASYSIFKNKEIDLKEYDNLPDYPTKITSRYSVERLIGNFKNKDKLSLQLDNINSELNDTNNPNNKEKVKSYKQVNLMFVNFGDKSEDYGWALQDYWKNGAKNDFVVTFGTDSKGNITWCHTFSWTDVEILKSDVREYMVDKNIKDFSNIMNGVSDLVEKKFDRKQFIEFDYIQIDVTTFSKVVIAICVIAACVLYFVVSVDYRY